MHMTEAKCDPEDKKRVDHPASMILEQPVDSAH